MKVEVELISKEIIRPSSPTPDHLREYQLSFLDQISPPVFNPMAIFYSSQDRDHHKIVNTKNISDHLKKSLSEVLVQFYPLAGRVNANRFIDCNDEGIPYLETRVKCQLSDVIQNPIPSDLDKFIPFQVDQVSDLALGVQLNVFDCAGIALGLCISHKVADALSFFNFIKTWAAIAGKDIDHQTVIVGPQFVSATLFPPRNISGFNPRVGITKANIITKRFVFESSMIEALKAKYGQGLANGEKPPSRVEALSAFIWNRYVAATSTTHPIESSEEVVAETERVYAIIHAVNLRTRIDPQLPEYSFGNLYRIAMTFPRLDTGEEECYGLLRQVRDQVSRVDKNYVKKLQEGCEHLDFIKQQSENFSKGEIVTLSFTSLCRFPLYEADFGWGKPTWVGSPSLTFNNLIVFMDTKSGGGVETYINMKVQDLAKIEADEEFLAFVSPNGLN